MRSSEWQGHTRTLTFERRHFVVIVVVLLAVVGCCRRGWRYRGTRRSSSAGLRHIAEQVVEHVGKELCRVEGAATTAGLVAFRSVRVSSTASTTTATGHPGSARTPVVVLAGAAPESVLGADEVDLLDNGEDNLGREVVDRDSATFDLGAASLGLVVGHDRVGLVARGRARSVGHEEGLSEAGDDDFVGLSLVQYTRMILARLFSTETLVCRSSRSSVDGECGRREMKGRSRAVVGRRRNKRSSGCGWSCAVTRALLMPTQGVAPCGPSDKSE